MVTYMGTSVEMAMDRKKRRTLICSAKSQLCHKLIMALIDCIQCVGPGTKVHKRLAVGDDRINPLDEATKAPV